MINSGDITQAVRHLNEQIMEETAALHQKQLAIDENDRKKTELKNKQLTDEQLIGKDMREIEAAKKDSREIETKLRENERNRLKLENELKEAQHKLDHAHSEIKLIERNATDLLNKERKEAQRGR